MAKKHSPDQVDVAALQTMLRGAGLRSTTARMAVIQRLQAANSPMSHSELAEELMPLGFDKATIFRNLADLTNAGLVVRSELGDHVWRFEFRDHAHSEIRQHPHFVCIDCGNITCLDQATLEKQLKTIDDQIGHVTEVLLRGHCTSCQ